MNVCCCRKHAFVDLATEMDLTKALALNGEILLDKPMKITKVKMTSEDKVKVNARSLDKKGKIVLLIDIRHEVSDMSFSGLFILK